MEDNLIKLDTLIERYEGNCKNHNLSPVNYGVIFLLKFCNIKSVRRISQVLTGI